MATTAKTASWGVTETSPVTGVITDFEEGVETVLAPEQNEVGSIINQTMYDKHFTASATIQVAKGTEKPKAGSAIMMKSKSYYVTSSRVTENNTSYRKISVTAERYEHCTATESASGIGTGD